MKKCPYCAEEIQDEAIVCRYCGRDLTKLVTPLPPAVQQIKEQPKKPNHVLNVAKPSKPSQLRKLALFAGGLLSICFLSVCFITALQSSSKPAKQVQPSETAPVRVAILTNTPSGTNTPKPTRTPRPTTTPEFGTLDNPHPYAAEVPLTFTSQGNKSFFTLQVLNVIRGDDANNIISNANMFNDDPPAGASWMLVQVKVTLTDGSAFNIRSYDLAVISGGQIFGGLDFSVCCTEEMGFPELDASIALAGTSVEGWVIRPVLLTDEKPMLAVGINDYQPDMKKGIFLALHP